MKAKVIGIRSGSGYTDKERRVRLKFEGASCAYDELDVRESMLGLARVELDMELEVEVELAVSLAKGARVDDWAGGR